MLVSYTKFYSNSRKMNEELLKLAKKDLRQMIIEENGEDYYYNLIAEKTRNIHQFKMDLDNVFDGDDDMFRDECRRSIIAKYDDEQDQFLNLVLTDIALDTILD